MAIFPSSRPDSDEIAWRGLNRGRIRQKLPTRHTVVPAQAGICLADRSLKASGRDRQSLGGDAVDGAVGLRRCEKRRGIFFVFGFGVDHDRLLDKLGEPENLPGAYRIERVDGRQSLADAAIAPLR